MASVGFSEALASLTPRQRWGRLSLVGAVLLTVSGAFAYAAGWLTPRALTPGRIIDTFEAVNGPHPGFRRNHAKGVGVSGTFVSSGLGARISKASVFRAGSFAVIGRFALAGGMPHAADALKTVRSLALEFALPNGETWRTGMNAIPVFPVRTPEAFHEQLTALAPDPATSKPNPERVRAFFRKYPETERAIARIQSQKPTAGFAESTYNSLNAFVLVDAAGNTTKVRWSLVPEVAPSTELAPGTGPNFLFDALIARIRQNVPKWHLILKLGGPGDPTNDATVEWPPERETIDAGTLTLDRIEGEATSPARTINFDPLVLPAGIVGSDDPLLSARSAAYAVSFRRRAGETVTASDVTLEASRP